MSYLREWKNGKSKFRRKCASKSKRRHTFLPVRAQVRNCQACVLSPARAWSCRAPWDVCSAPTGAETGQGGAPKGRGWEWYTRYRQAAKILRINQSIFLTLVKSANYLYETRRKSALFRKGGGCMEYRGNQCSGRECALSRG